ncbi:DMT family transporter [Mammaliicoccus sciuri]|uniref:Permease of the drug/metabolite transporter (DMT) superfamily n=2 Tax=Sporosarcina newyorkensis TaxID=759851 RepID=A0A1T4YKM6_9BACL|nr:MULTISPECIES: DMT family transporter [Sporosarcina]EGQ21840.1 EamA family transporter [Sporosarcina newyorkensis 2681]MBY0221259.1 DMT family transporter [Sporosarcina aquimarina]SKB02407.1 Permease of the drug/metabolite transporter (DMT) superfamily [Sporosarcina newyorkensis]
MKNKIIWGAFLCFIASASWGAMFPVANSAFKAIDPFYFTLIRYVSVTILLVILLWWKEGKQAFRLEKRGLSLWFFGTMAFVVYNLFIFWGEDLMGEPGIMVASISEAMMPMISIVIVWFISRQKPHGFTLTCVFTAFIGVMLVITKGDLRTFLTATDDIIPSLLIFLAVIGWVVYTMGGNQFSEWSSLRYSTLSCLLGTATACVIVFFVTLTGYISVPTLATVQTVSPHMLFMIVFPGIIALLGWNVGVRILSPLNGLLFINFVPVTTLVISFVQGYQLTVFDYIGTVFIILSLVGNNIFLRLQQKRKDEVRQYKKQSAEPSVSA